jgi:excinuclease ABC subunit C
MAKQKKHRFSIKGIPLYPHIEITRERFPRVLATRLLDEADAEYFGAFLNRSNARILIDFLNRTFRLRSCEIEVDGSFNYPCTMYYKRRCTAPCVSDLIDDTAYGEMVSLVRLFLQNDHELFRVVLGNKIDASSSELDFETAAKWRDILSEAEDYWANSRTYPWTYSVSDTFYERESATGLDIFLISQKSRRTLGERIFSFPEATEADSGEAIADVIEQFYHFHAPKEIRVSRDFARRGELQKNLSKKFGRRVPIILLNGKNRKISTDIAIYKSTTELDVKRLIALRSPRELTLELKKLFKLAKVPNRISAIDVSHISGTDQVAAAIAWEDGENIPNAAEYLLSDGSSELRALAELIAKRYLKPREEFVLIDGGMAQLNAAAVDLPKGAAIDLVSAVKPPGQHSEISHFLTVDGRRIDFDPTSPAMLLLQRLRNEAHDFANAVHRDTRDYAHFYEMVNIAPSLAERERQHLLQTFGSHTRILNASEQEIAKSVGKAKAAIAMQDIVDYRNDDRPRIKPLVVPIRFQDEKGAAEDLRPIEAAPGKMRRLR